LAKPLAQLFRNAMDFIVQLPVAVGLTIVPRILTTSDEPAELLGHPRLIRSVTANYSNW
jgi:hypothetical protein